MKQKILLALVLLAATFFLYFPIFRYGFFQDDFFHLINTQIPFSGLLKFFTDNSAIYYRPLGIQFTYWWQQQLFDSSPVYFHAFGFFIHLVTVYLVYSLINQITRKQSLAYLTAFLYSTSSIHFISLFWLAETNLLLAGLMFFLNLHLIWWIHTKQSLIKVLLCWILFGLGLLTHELLIITPLLIIIFNYSTNFRLFRSRFSKTYLIGLIIIATAYLVLRFVVLPVPITGTYKLQLGKDTLKSSIWYILWSLNLPEELKYQFILSQLTFQPKFVPNFIPQLTIWASSLIIILLINISKLVQLWSSHRRLILLGLTWFISGLSLFLLLPLHQYPMYALAALPGLTLLIALALNHYHPSVRILVVMIWIIASLVTLRFTELTHWTIQEAERTAQVFKDAQRFYPHFPPGSTLTVPPSYKISQVLFDQLGFQFLYQNHTLKTYYGDFHAIMPESCKIIEQTHADIRPCLARHGIYLLYY